MDGSSNRRCVSGRRDDSRLSEAVDRRECTGDIKYSAALLPFIGPRSLHLLRRLKFLLRIFFYRTPSHALDAICFTWPLQSEWPREGLNVPFCMNMFMILARGERRKSSTERTDRGRGTLSKRGANETYSRLLFVLSFSRCSFPFYLYARYSFRHAGIHRPRGCHSENRMKRFGQ